MTVNIIHLPHRADRLKLLKQELLEQNIIEYKIWNGIVDSEVICRGISQAHKQIVRNAKALNLPEVLIAEDDLHFTAPGAFQYFLDKKPIDFDIYLGGIMFGQIDANNIVQDFSGTALYLLNRRFYDILLSIPEESHLDRSLRFKGKYIVCNPFIAIQHNGYSDNKKRHCDYFPYLKGRKFY